MRRWCLPVRTLLLPAARAAAAHAAAIAESKQPVNEFHRAIDSRLATQ